ncbi:hypothetical protein JW960_10155 [candidate division KSB1 bacterium]|nr:hypothetical protein [candidate division KSB1 bacterium]
MWQHNVRIWVFIISILFGLTTGYAQIDIGTAQYPPGMNWQQLSTEHFHVIYPKALTADAQRVANLLERTYNPLQKSLDGRFTRLPVILGNQTAQANGFVTLAPWHSEFYSIPPQSGFVGDWYETLAVHEIRHAVQFTKMDQKFVRLGRIAFGEAGWAAFSIVAAPAWFWEGDAVLMETALTRTGRGRSPWFDLGLRAPLLKHRRYSYSKAYFRSFQDYIPDHYTLGYHLVTYVRRQNTGQDMWNQVLNRSTRMAFWPFTFSNSLKHYTDASISDTYNQAMEDLSDLWSEQLKRTPIVDVSHIPMQPASNWDNYLYPQPQRDGSVIALRTGLGTPSTLVRVTPDGDVHTIRQIAPYDKISARGGKIVWNEIVPDIRWGNRDYADIVVLDLKTNHALRLTTHRKLFAPALSPDGQLIAAVEYTSESTCSIVILDAATGQQMNQFVSPNNDFITTPAWALDSNSIICVLQNHDGRALALVDVESGKFKQLTQFAPEEISDPQIVGNTAVYHSNQSGIENIRSFDIVTGQYHVLTSRPYSVVEAAISPDGTRLYFQDYDWNGHRIAYIPFQPNESVVDESQLPPRIDYFAPIADEENTVPLFSPDSIHYKPYGVKPYHPWEHLLKVHSWYLLPADPWYYAQLISTDLMNRMAFMPGIVYNTNEHATNYFASVEYAGFFPIFDVNTRIGERVATFNYEGKTHYYDWQEKSVGGGFRIPLNLSRGIYSTHLNLSAHVSYTSISDQRVGFGIERNDRRYYTDHNNGTLIPMQYSFSFNRSRRASYRDFQPRWAQSVNIFYRHTPFEADYRGEQFAVQGQLFFPGIFNHHSLRLSSQFEHQQPYNYIFSEQFQFPRGYDYVYYSTLARASVDYALPLWYPDVEFGSFLYWKRMKANLFADYAIGDEHSDRDTFKSVGVDVSLEMFPFTLPLSIDFGVRAVYRFTDRESRIEPMVFGALPLQ